MTFTTAFVTGATSGIGAAIARILAARGLHVVVGGRDAARGSAVVDDIRAAGGKADFLALDLHAAPSVLRTSAADVADLLGGRVDVLINNAALYPVGPTEALDDDDLDAMLAVNVRAPHVLVGALAPAMAERGSGAIVTIGSWMATLGGPFGAMYSATKAADEQLTRSWAAEYGPRGVRVNAVAPGATATPGNEFAAEAVRAMAATTPGGVPLQPEDVANAVAFLVSDEARMVHGATFAVDGGITVARLG
ncbi:SDR family NAD(P)-dependent oxidoreductase [Cryptosporangium arvum]|uniref:SDR family NAD(P)-dependent oxidoreductase n=1 Tax=Cryptosporangium arvum TaxID=80871 RepID=UPI0004B0307B|nr:SDR family oxidoreductase [Cryptosporangium arvum]